MTGKDYFNIANWLPSLNSYGWDVYNETNIYHVSLRVLGYNNFMFYIISLIKILLMEQITLTNY